MLATFSCGCAGFSLFTVHRAVNAFLQTSAGCWTVSNLPVLGSHCRSPCMLQLECMNVGTKQSSEWLYCRLEHAPSAELMAAFSQEASNKLQQFAPQNISNMLWAYATLGHSPGVQHSLACISTLLGILSLSSPNNRWNYGTQRAQMSGCCHLKL